MGADDMSEAQSKSHKILVIKLSAFGDFILALGSMAAIRKQHPEAEITLLTTPIFKELAERTGFCDKIELCKRYKWHDVTSWWKLRQFLRHGGFSRVYDLQMNGRTKAMYRMLPKAAQKQFSGVVAGSDLFYPDPNWRDMHALDRHKAVLKVAGIEDVTIPDMTWMDGDISRFELKKPYVLLVPGCAPTRPDKKWPSKKYAGLAQKLDHEGYQAVLIGGPAEVAIGDEITMIAKNAVNLIGMTSFFDIAALARQASGAVGNDTGPIHLIAASSCPTLTLFSSASNPEHSAPCGAAVKIIQADDMADISLTDVMKAFEPRKIASS